MFIQWSILAGLSCKKNKLNNAFKYYRHAMGNCQRWICEAVELHAILHAKNVSPLTCMIGEWNAHKGCLWDRNSVQ